MGMTKQIMVVILVTLTVVIILTNIIIIIIANYFGSVYLIVCCVHRPTEASAGQVPAKLKIRLQIER